MKTNIIKWNNSMLGRCFTHVNCGTKYSKSMYNITFFNDKSCNGSEPSEILTNVLNDFEKIHTNSEPEDMNNGTIATYKPPDALNPTDPLGAVEAPDDAQDDAPVAIVQPDDESASIVVQKADSSLTDSSAELSLSNSTLDDSALDNSSMDDLSLHDSSAELSLNNSTLDDLALDDSTAVGNSTEALNPVDTSVYAPVAIVQPDDESASIVAQKDKSTLDDLSLHDSSAELSLHESSLDSSIDNSSLIHSSLNNSSMDDLPLLDSSLDSSIDDSTLDDSFIACYSAETLNSDEEQGFSDIAPANLINADGYIPCHIITMSNNFRFPSGIASQNISIVCPGSKDDIMSFFSNMQIVDKLHEL